MEEEIPPAMFDPSPTKTDEGSALPVKGYRAVGQTTCTGLWNTVQPSDRTPADTRTPISGRVKTEETTRTHGLPDRDCSIQRLSEYSSSPHPHILERVIISFIGEQDEESYLDATLDTGGGKFAKNRIHSEKQQRYPMYPTSEVVRFVSVIDRGRSIFLSVEEVVRAVCALRMPSRSTAAQLNDDERALWTNTLFGNLVSASGTTPTGDERHHTRNT
ncbi:hypothetical protein B0H11DRAFT_1904521 [Mycena galericulata]|nr:hypothetical protein B0H11DRAFT_1904521 [Mycena galericulata]